MLSRRKVATSTMLCGSTFILIRSGLIKTTLTKSPNSFLISSTSPFSKGGGSGSFFGGEAAAPGLEAAAVGLVEGAGGLAATGFGSVGGLAVVVLLLELIDCFGWLAAAGLS